MKKKILSMALAMMLASLPIGIGMTAYADSVIDYDAIYGPILDDVYATYGEYQPYYVYDIDNDGIMELIINEGTSIAMGSTQYYTIRNGAASVLDSDYADVSFYIPYDGNGLLQAWGRQGAEEISRMNKNGSQIVFSEVLGGTAGWDDLDSLGTPLPYAYTEDHSLLRAAGSSTGSVAAATNQYSGCYYLTVGGAPYNGHNFQLDIDSISNGYLTGNIHCGGQVNLSEVDEHISIEFREDQDIPVWVSGTNLYAMSYTDGGVSTWDQLSLYFSNGIIYVKRLSAGYGDMPGASCLNAYLPTGGQYAIMLH